MHLPAPYHATPTPPEVVLRNTSQPHAVSVSSTGSLIALLMCPLLSSSLHHPRLSVLQQSIRASRLSLFRRPHLSTHHHHTPQKNQNHSSKYQHSLGPTGPVSEQTLATLQVEHGVSLNPLPGPLPRMNS